MMFGSGAITGIWRVCASPWPSALDVPGAAGCTEVLSYSMLELGLGLVNSRKVDCVVFFVEFFCSSFPVCFFWAMAAGGSPIFTSGFLESMSGGGVALRAGFFWLHISPPSVMWLGCFVCCSGAGLDPIFLT